MFSELTILPKHYPILGVPLLAKSRSPQDMTIKYTQVPTHRGTKHQADVNIKMLFCLLIEKTCLDGKSDKSMS